MYQIGPLRSPSDRRKAFHSPVMRKPDVYHSAGTEGVNSNDFPPLRAVVSQVWPDDRAEHLFLGAEAEGAGRRNVKYVI